MGGVIRDAQCRLCPRLAGFLDTQRAAHPDWHNAPVNGFGPLDAPILVVGLAPGMRGANRTGRPFTGDYAGDLLYETLARHGLSRGEYDARPDDGLALTGIRIVNSVRCLPPENKPTPDEVKTCRRFLLEDMAAMPRLAVFITLGSIAHRSTIAALGLRQADFPFRHGGEYELPKGVRPRHLIASYHCSRYNTNTGRLTPEMFHAVFARAIMLARGGHTICTSQVC